MSFTQRQSISCSSFGNAEETNPNKIASMVSKNFKRSIKILVLGCENSGKTTLINHMRILHGGGFNYEEKQMMYNEILQNIHRTLIGLINSMLDYKQTFDSLEHEIYATKILPKFENITRENLTPEYVHTINRIWNDTGITNCFNQSLNHRLWDNMRYFMNKIIEFTRPSYELTETDILKNYHQKDKPLCFEFEVVYPFTTTYHRQMFKLQDISNQNENKPKFLKFLDGIEVIIFMISCSDFDKYVLNDCANSKSNYLRKSFNKLSDLINSPFLNTNGVIIFLNKMDILEQKLSSGKYLEKYFPEYGQFQVKPSYEENASPDESPIYKELDRVQKFLQCEVFVRFNNGPQSKLQCYYHYTDTTDMKGIPSLINIVKYIISTSNLMKYEIL